MTYIGFVHIHLPPSLSESLPLRHDQLRREGSCHESKGSKRDGDRDTNMTNKTKGKGGGEERGGDGEI